MMKPAGGDKPTEPTEPTEPMEVEPPVTGDDTGDKVAEETAKEAKAASETLPMAGSAGKTAKKSGKVASTSKDGGEPYSPTQSAEDWAENLRGVRRLMSTPMPVPPPASSPPPNARKEKGEPEKGEKGNVAVPAATGDPSSSDAGGTTTGGEAENPSVIERANEFVRKRRVDEIKSRLGKDMMIYQSIRARNICDTKASNLLGTVSAYAPAATGMVDTGDGRMMTGGLKMALTDKRVITCSFNYNWTCTKCEQHQDRPALRLRGEAGSGAAQAIVLSDQNFPAVLPVSGTEQCLKIVRIENGGLLELTDELLNLVGNRRVPPGSIVLLLSPTHLTKVGLSAYISDHLEAGKRIQSRLGKETRIAPLPPLLLAGCGDKTTVREIFEFLAWAKDYYKDMDCMLEETFEEATRQLRRTGTGVQEDLEPRRYRLPAAGGEEKLWFSGGKYRGCTTATAEIPESIKPASQTTEMAVVKSLLTELQNKLALDLDPNPTFERGLGLQTSTKKAVDFLVIGSSNAAKTAKALEDRGFSVSLIYKANWRVTSEAVEQLTSETASAIQDMDPTTIVYQILDNSSFYGRTRDGSRTAPRSEEDGIFHLVGDVTISTKETQLEHFNIIKPLLNLASKRRCILVTPLPRYVISGCCLNPDHCSNRRYQDFKQHMLGTLEMYRKNFKDFLYYGGMKNIKVMDPCMDIRGMEDSDVWDLDPVHPLPLVYAKMAGGVIKMMNSMAESEHKRRRIDSLEGSSMSGSDARRGRHDSAFRGDWTEGNRGRGRGDWRARGRAFGGGAGGRGGNRSRGDGGNRFF
jgi:hypothetical protein